MFQQENTDDAHRDSHYTRFSQLRAQITTERQRGRQEEEGGATDPSQAYYRQSHQNWKPGQCPFKLKAFSQLLSQFWKIRVSEQSQS